jgi:hypothetical protein
MTRQACISLLFCTYICDELLSGSKRQNDSYQKDGIEKFLHHFDLQIKQRQTDITHGVLKLILSCSHSANVYMNVGDVCPFTDFETDYFTTNTIKEKCELCGETHNRHYACSKKYENLVPKMARHGGSDT